jgi:hypothetical protein
MWARLAFSVLAETLRHTEAATGTAGSYCWTEKDKKPDRRKVKETEIIQSTMDSLLPQA